MDPKLIEELRLTLTCWICTISLSRMMTLTMMYLKKVFTSTFSEHRLFSIPTFIRAILLRRPAKAGLSYYIKKTPTFLFHINV